MVARLVLIGLLVVWGATTHRRAEAWQTERSLWEAAAAVVPENPRVRVNLGLALAHEGDARGALVQYALAQRAIDDSRRTVYQREASFAQAGTNAADVLAELGQPQAALSQLEPVIARQPWFADARWNRGVILTALGDCAGAAGDFAVAVQRRPEWVIPPCP